jgi:hypothetical protein
MPRLAGRLLVLLSLLTAAVALASAQGGDAGSLFRVFLSDGRAIPSYGESAVVGDRLVFTLLVSASAGPPALQLMSLPLPSVDLPRTQRYATSLRATHYAATRGEADYAAMTAEVQRALDQITSIPDTKQRLDVAEEAKRRLLSWSAEHYYYRAADIRELAGLFDQVIAELRAAAGESRFSLDLRTGFAAPVSEPLLAAPSVRESVTLARAAAAVSDVVEERLAVLRTASAVLSRESDVDDLKAGVARDLEAEATADAAYKALAEDLAAKADAALRRGDVEGVQGLRAVLAERDRALGARRPAHAAAIAALLDTKLEAVRIHRKALDHYAAVRKSLLEYERRVRTVMSGLDGLAPILAHIRDGKYSSYDRLVGAAARISELSHEVGSIQPPADLADVHATLRSAIHMAAEACSRRRLAVTTTSEDLQREASAAAAGSILLTSHSRDQLIARLFPPKIQ